LIFIEFVILEEEQIVNQTVKKKKMKEKNKETEGDRRIEGSKTKQ